MNVNQSARGLVRSTRIIPQFTTSVRPQVLRVRPLVPSRTLFGWLRSGRGANDIVDPTSERFRPSTKKNNSQEMPEQGGLAKGSIFDEGTEAASKDKQVPEEVTSIQQMNPEHMASVLNPKPATRERWERRMVVRDIRKGRRINKTTLIARNERQHVLRSYDFKTSLKKLMPLARQIAGKPIDEAITQMRFSKKRVAKDILSHLERARDEATVVAGMGLGPARRARASAQGETHGDTAPVEDKLRMLVVDTKGNKRIVTDATAMYVDQAWIGKGIYRYRGVKRAKHQKDKETRRFASITVQLKEEQTRIRLQNERADKAAARKPWVNLPDRPVTRQTQYPLW